MYPHGNWQPGARTSIDVLSDANTTVRRLNVTSQDSDPNHLEDHHTSKLEALKKAVSEGTYAVSVEDLAPKIMESMLQNTIIGETTNRASTSQLGVADRLIRSKRTD
jgi:anti-sigma28 factor (negative regulator of flagellin synthesis)